MLDLSDGSFLLPLRLVQLVCATIGYFPASGERGLMSSVGVRHSRTRESASLCICYKFSHDTTYCCILFFRGSGVDDRESFMLGR